MANQLRKLTRKTVWSLIVLTLFFTSASAFAADGGWQLRLFGIWVSPTVDEEIEGDRITDQSEIGGGFTLERRFSDRLGFELGMMSAKPEIEVTTTDVVLCGDTFCELSLGADLPFTPLHAGLDVHLTPDSKADFYVGPMVAYIQYGNPTFHYEDQILEVSVDNDWTWGVQAGVDYDLSGRWSLHGGLRYFDTDLDARTEDDPESVKIGFDPVVVTLGFGHRF